MKKLNYAEHYNKEDFYDCHITVRENSEKQIDLTDNDILSFSKDGTVYFLDKAHIRKLWEDFTHTFTIDLGQEQTVFEDDYSNDFGVFCINRMFTDSEDIKWFSHLIEYGFELYEREVG